jgi:hypothetical protein
MLQSIFEKIVGKTPLLESKSYGDVSAIPSNTIDNPDKVKPKFMDCPGTATEKPELIAEPKSFH